VTRALVFDLDDTLYAERRYALSGFRAVANHVASSFGADRCAVFQALWRSLRGGRRASAFQSVTAEFALPAAAVEAMRDAYRAHAPELRLPESSRAVLAKARQSWRVGILTNGLPEIQRRKVKALGVEDLVDVVVYAQETCGGKPEAAAFRAVCAALDVPEWRAVMTGDDPWCDIDGGRRAGLRVIRIRRGIHRHVTAGETGPADVTVERLADVPGEAGRLIQEGERRAD
jgi:putative hydrolase of the HAD superfamily